MRLFRTIIILLLLVSSGYFLLNMFNVIPKESVMDISNTPNNKASLLKSKSVPERNPYSIDLEGGLYHWIGKDTEQLTNEWGKPVRKDLSAYGYEWWVYTDETKRHIQFGVKDNTITTLYATGSNLSLEPIHIGQSYGEVKKQFTFKNNVTLHKGISSFTFKLDEKEMDMRPLVKLTEDVFLQFYFDTFTSTLSSIRVLTGDILLKQRPYAIQYRGKLPEAPNPTDDEWEKIENGMEQQIFSITNVMRNQHEKSQLKWGDAVSEVAFLHSKDMAVNNYFSHYGLNGDGLKERLAAMEVFYLAAGENIAAQYPDAPAAMQGWLNSKSHREALLDEKYTHLGVGVYHFYYTQNFLQKP